MIVQRYTQKTIFESLIPENLKNLDKELSTISKIIDRDEILETIESIIVVKNPKAKKAGRKGYSLEQRIRCLLIKHMYGLSYAETIKMIQGSIPFREFTKLYFEKVPDVSRLKRWMKSFGNETVKAIHDLVIEIAKERKVIKGKILRSDSTAVETDIHYPTDSTLIGDSIRKICRAVEKLKEEGVKIGKRGRNYGRCIKRRIIRLIKFARGKGEQAKERLKQEYKELLRIGNEVIKNVKEIKRVATRQAKKSKDYVTQMAITELSNEIEHWKEMLGKVIEQTHERIIKGNLQFKEKILSIFEPHSEVIRKGKAGKPNEFGRKIEITEAENKIITDYKVLEGNMCDSENLPDIIDRHKERFERPPDLVAHDRGGWTKEMEEILKQKGVKRISIPAKGKRSKEREIFEKQRWFKKAQRYRAGSEGTISKLKRRHKLTRCLYKGEEGMGIWVGMGVIASNLITLAH